MIAPRTSLVIGAGVLVLPLAVLASFVPALAMPCLAALAGVALWDAARGLRGAGRISLRLPAAVRGAKDCETRVPLEIGNESGRAVALRAALRLPESVEPARTAESFMALPGVTRIAFAMTPHRRGDFRIAAADLERSSPWGFWSIRTSLALDCVLRVYPNLRSTATRALFLSRAAAGVQPQRQLGRGREFETLRDYIPGDCYEDVYWKATARRARPIVKVFQVERTQELYVAVDASRLSAREGVLEKYVTAALHLGLAAQKQGDLFGLITFSDKLDRFVRARKGDEHFRTCREAIYRVESRRVSPDFSELFSFVQTTLRKRALLVVLTSLDDPVLAESFADAARLAARRHVVLANVAQMPGIQPFFSGSEPATTGELSRKVAGQLYWKRLGELRVRLAREGVRLTVLHPDRMEGQLTSQYLAVKQRQAL